MKLTAVLLTAVTCLAQNYSATKTRVDEIEVIRLADKTHETEVSIAPTVGNIAYELKVKGANLFWFPDPLGKYREAHGLAANPFLGPWANRLDHDGFWANGKSYALNPALNNIRRDQNGRPIHGLLTTCPYWRVVSIRADESGAEVTSRLEFWKYPDLAAQFPFAHTVDMTYRLSGGVLEVRTRVENLATEPMPLVIGYHPFFQLHDSPRDAWKVHIAARRHVVITKEALPTGESEPLAVADPQPLEGTQVDDIFTDLVRGADGRAVFWVQGKAQKLSVIYGPKYNTAIIYTPRNSKFVCFEPMSGITNGANLAQAGKYKELQSVPAGGTWEESYWVAPSGF